ncbi:MAG: hypothetical protein FWE35_00860 [Streptosporangiales bacterium]|nr:hypothetical protein [Streptosporangiales bacterium]
MIRLSGDAAEERLNRAWDTILARDPADQEIIHVLAEPSPEPEWIAGFGPFRAWADDGERASGKVWEMFAAIAGTWPYIAGARRAAAAGIPNTRILVLRQDRLESAPAWFRYLALVHLPGISAMSGEDLYLVRAEDCRAAGLAVRNHDVNLFGAAGAMTAGGDNGDVEWRAFVDEVQDPELFRQEHDYLTAVRAFTARHGVLIALPSSLQLAARPAKTGR